MYFIIRVFHRFHSEFGVRCSRPEFPSNEASFSDEAFVCKGVGRNADNEEPLQR